MNFEHFIKKPFPKEKYVEELKPSSFDNAFDAQEKRGLAIERAKAELQAAGRGYPVKGDMSTIEFYDATSEYGRREAALIQKYLKVEKPIAQVISSKPKWGQPYYD